MRKVHVKQLTHKEFKCFGFFENLRTPQSYHFGDTPIKFYRDMIGLNLGLATTASFSVCQVSKRPLIIDKIEFHSKTSEGILPLDADILIHVGPATGIGDAPLDQIEVFRVPQGTMVVLKQGVWHHAPFAYNTDKANVLIVLPERTYAIDCAAIKIEQKNRIEINEH